jgi:protein-L-isoaspartate(D-aspartate) O-methyltransferase
MFGRETIPSLEERRAQLINQLASDGSLLPGPMQDNVRAALLRVPRHLFVPGVYLEAVYRDTILVTKRDKYGAALVACPQPSTLAHLLSELDVQPGQNVLEIGTGTGYTAALLADIVGPEGRVTSLEIDAEVADAARSHLDRAGYGHVSVIHTDGANGWPDAAPFDCILVSLNLWDIPTAWPAQLAPEGKLAVALGINGIQLGTVLSQTAPRVLTSGTVFPMGFLNIQGQAAGPDKHVHLPGSSMEMRIPEGTSLNEASLHTLLSDDQEIIQLPLELDRRNLGMFSYYLLFHQPASYNLVTYSIPEGQLAYGMHGIGWGVVSPASACLVPYGDQRVVYAFGGSDAYYELAKRAREWQQAGQPGLERTHLAVTPVGQPFDPPAASASRAYTRTAHIYTLWQEARPAAEAEDDPTVPPDSDTNAPADAE